MTIKVFEFTRTSAEVPVTIFAHDLDEAEKQYRDWVKTHHPGHSTEPEMIYPYFGSKLKARPFLDAAAALGRVGVGYWKNGTRIWVIGGPEDKPSGDLALPEPRVSFYRVKAEEGDDASVFARSFEQATSLFSAWHLDRWGDLPTRFFIHTLSRWDLLGELATLRDDMEAELTGVAGRDNYGIWRILPPDWEPSYGRE